MKPKTSGFIYGRNDAPNLDYALYSLWQQELDKVFYVDDGSTDDSVLIAQKNGAKVIRAREKGKSRLATPRLSWTANAGLKYVKGSDYFVISGSDIWLPKNYVKTIVDLMEKDSRVVLASGVIEGESWNPVLPKGAGRVHRASFWWRHIREHPFSFIWESYPVYKALSMGLKTVVVPQLKMKVLRPSGNPRVINQVYAMRQLGCFFPYAMVRAFRIAKMKGLVSYLRSKYPIVDKELSNFIKRRDCQRLLNGLRKHGKF